MGRNVCVSFPSLLLDMTLKVSTILAIFFLLRSKSFGHVHAGGAGNSSTGIFLSSIGWGKQLFGQCPFKPQPYVERIDLLFCKLLWCDYIVTMPSLFRSSVKNHVLIHELIWIRRKLTSEKRRLLRLNCSRGCCPL